MRALIVLILLCSSLALGQAHAESTTARYTMLTMGKPSGYMSLEQVDPLKRKVHYEFSDRGRGPSLDAEYQLDKNGLPQSLSIRGVNYLKAPVDERFTRTAKNAQWKNSAEDETSELKDGFYLALEGTPEDTAMLVRAGLRDRSRPLALLPSGQARVSKLTELSVGAGGKRLRVALYALEGLDLTPSLIWLDQDQELFASYSPWFSLVRDGYEASLETIGAKQIAEEAKMAQKRAEELTTWVKKPLLIQNARVFDVEKLSVSEPQSVLIKGGKIVSLGAALVPESGTEILDAQGQFLMPGLWDMHVHIGAGTEGMLQLMSGVTSVRDMANDQQALDTLEAAIESGKDLGPRIVRAGFIDGRGPFAGPTKVFADTEQEAIKAVNDYADAGYRQIKVYSSLKPELVPVIAGAAKARGLRLSGHVPQGMNAEAFIEQGADELQHANFVFLNFLAGPKVDTRTPQRFTTVAESAHGVALSGAPMQRLIALMKSKDIEIDPTLMTFEGMFLDRPGRMGPTFASSIHRLPPSWQRGIRAAQGGLPTNASNELNYKLSYQRMIDVVGVLHRAGVQILAGTDAFPMWALQRELELYVSSGIAPAEALRIASFDAPRVMGIGDRYGKIAPGMVADLILIDGDPSIDIRDLRNVRTIIRGDRRFDAAAIRRKLGIAE